MFAFNSGHVAAYFSNKTINNHSKPSNCAYINQVPMSIVQYSKSQQVECENATMSYFDNVNEIVNNINNILCIFHCHMNDETVGFTCASDIVPC